MRKRFLFLLTMAILMVSLLALSACAAAPEPEVEAPPAVAATPTPAPATPPPLQVDLDDDAVYVAVGMFAAIEALQERFPAEMPRGQGVGGVMQIGRAVTSPFAGVLNPVFSITADDGFINDFMFSSVLRLGVGNIYVDNGPARLELDREASTATIHFHDDTAMYWHDGVPVTMYDLEWAYMMIAHPDTFSDRFGTALNTSTVAGVEEFRAGTADHISGIRVFNDGRSIEITYSEPISPAIQFGGIWSTPMPRHRWQDIPWVEHRDHSFSRYDIVGSGAFMFVSTVPGESVTMEANPNFWLGAPALDGIVVSAINPALIGESMLIGEFDLVNFPEVALEDYEDRFPGAVTIVSALERRFDFLGFRFGFLDTVEGINTPNPDTIINCLALRRAIGYARDDLTPANTIFGGVRFPLATTIIPWSGVNFMRTDIDGFSVFDLDKANEILDEAGYEWIAGEEFRRHNVTGEPFEIVWAVHDNATNPLLVPHHTQNWAAVGLNVVLFGGGLMEFNDRIETLTHDLDEGAIHMYDAAWLKGSNPDPASLWGPTSPHNDTRWQHPRTDAILANIASDQAWDSDWLIEQYHDWQLAVYELAPWIPVTTAVALWSANDRVLNYSLVVVDDPREVGQHNWHLWDLSRPTPFTGN